ncbi:hypothetical protein [Wenxinia saemankumensis]|uniref:Predicted lipoprotein with conserved Yx(FWY)xxD motif n=1 Tax=Wenxinia saemankumensis TaxID=1447782 RepID=A0A1M6EHM2_9RHOB|nr:hypothetical protein [Wenxinia saemankumensis]SHI84933.1 Predicted lipoprotein with conserved Yx(FWY)xxD motif [Wenxinia saemankumensis]
MTRPLLPLAFAAATSALALAGAAQAQTDPSADLVDLMVIDSDYGPIIADGDGRPVYTFETNERAGDGQQPLESCNEVCQVDWPLVPAHGDPSVSEDLDPALVASLDWQGTEVLVYDSQPLFYFELDAVGESPKGQGNHSYGGWWYLLDPTGAQIDAGIAPDPGDPALNDPLIDAPESATPVDGEFERGTDG